MKTTKIIDEILDAIYWSSFSKNQRDSILTIISSKEDSPMAKANKICDLLCIKRNSKSKSIINIISKKTITMQRIAPNNQLPATHFIEVWKGISQGLHIEHIIPINLMDDLISGDGTNMYGTTIAIFRIRENKLPTKHKF